MGLRSRLRARLSGKRSRDPEPSRGAPQATSGASQPHPAPAVAPVAPAGSATEAAPTPRHGDEQAPHHLATGESAQEPDAPRVEPVGPVSEAKTAARSAVGINALLQDDHATSDAPIRNAHYAKAYESTGNALSVRVRSAASDIDLTFSCEPGEYVLDAAERAGLELPFSCRGGGCLVCAARIHEGQTEMDEQYVLDEQHIADGFRLLCCTSITTDAVFESHVEDQVD